jgi:uncharacterized protein YjbI with pentapeptide repeats
MTVYFKRPNSTPNWRNALEKLIPAAPSAVSLAAAAATPAAPLVFAASLVGFGAGAQKAIRDAVEAADPQNTVDERAWVWLRVTLTVAVFELLGSPRLRSPLDTNERKAATKNFLAGALDLDGEGTLDIPTLVNPANCPLIAPVIAQIPELARVVAPEHTLEDAQLRAELARLLRATAPRVYALDTPYYRAVADAVTGPFSEGARRDLAWARHEDWIRGLFHREPIFSPDADETIPLSAVYHRLRCFWHQEARPDGDRERDDPRERPRIAHVADLHETLHAWLRAGDHGDSIRVVAGGPGSGKSSFSRAFAVEVIEAGDHRVIYVPLQHMRLGADLRDLIGGFLRERWHATHPGGGAGFEENPLDWRSWEGLPYLLVFDGLDELSHDDDTARDLARKFVRSVHSMLAGLTVGGPRVRALILGRSAACQEALDEIELELRHLIHVAPLTRLVDGEAAAGVLGRVVSVEDHSGRVDKDERPAFWRQSATARNVAPEPTPEAVTAEEVNELNAEPLLLHLLIVSGYTGKSWREVADNRNLVYSAIFSRIFARNRKKDHPATRNLGEADFLTLLECLGLAAWRGNGRTGSAQEFAELRDLHATAMQRKRFGSLPAAQLGSVAIQIHTRRDTAEEGFEFVHKSFGEYLAARALLSAGLRAARLLTEGEEPWTEAATAEHWVKLFARAELTAEILQFLIGEARLRAANNAGSTLTPLIQLFNWTLAHGMPVHRVAESASFRELESMQLCAESALLALLYAESRRARSEQSGERVAPIRVSWPRGGASALLRRGVNPSMLGALDLRNAELEDTLLRWADLSGADLRGASLHSANLMGTDLRGANLQGVNAQMFYGTRSGIIEGRTDLRGADLSGADLRKADLRGVDLRKADLRGVDLREADLSEANLREANLSGADLMGAELREASLTDWICAAASLRFVDLRAATDFSPASVDSAFGVRSGIGRTLLPEGTDPPAHWHAGPDDEEDSEEEQCKYAVALATWKSRTSEN